MARDLQRRRGRERSGLFVAEGVRAVEELLRSPIVVRGALTSPALPATARGAALRAALADRGIAIEECDVPTFASAAGTDAPQGVLALAEIPRGTLSDVALPERPRLLVLDAIQDPGNAGTLLRTAAALGAAATLALPGTVDLWNAKVVRSAMGALFLHPVVGCTWDQLDGFLAARDIALWAADAQGEPIEQVLSPRAVALVVGNEGAGLSASAARRVTRRVAVRLDPGADSLNVAVAAGIILHRLRP